ncbi:HAMP domain-containing sensor histidine kinase [Bacteroides pyogenes]|uniref:sensor histidine kinase n=1 Tax=Bacteroides pyogenes TaxID=310300 RepID=UPI002A832CF5|nr:HAMP domain-containing sensor histidine kinase [Bacteroides pyogenes]MDY4249043.1 HAMP domain-containing sensor histidine kinase [Bacteroides pyogenes]
MKFNRRVYGMILGYVSLISAAAFCGMYLVFTQRAIIIGILLIVSSLFLAAALVRRLNAFQMKLKLFFDAIEDKEHTLCFDGSSSDADMNELCRSLNRVNDLLGSMKKQVRQQERFYFSLFEELPDGALAWNGEGKIILANTSALRLLGIEQLVFFHQLERLYPELGKYVRQKDKKLRSCLLTSVHHRQLSLSLNTMMLEQEVVTLLSIKDISRQLSDKESDSWNKLTRVLTHEIMNAIAPVVSLSQTLTSRPGVDEKTMRGLSVIREQSERLLEFTSSYRKFSCLPAPRKERFSLTGLLRELSYLLQPDFERQQIRFTLNAPSEVFVSGDKKQLSQVFLNLLKNSVQALSGHNAGEILVRIDGTDPLLISFTDNGPGIPDEIREKIFVPFFSTKKEGMGIGLSLCREIIQRHEGAFYLSESRPGRTTFTVEYKPEVDESENDGK